MTAREKLEAQEKRQKIFVKYNYTCPVCHNLLYHKSTPQLAHRIPNTKMFFKKYGKEIIHHELNLIPVCSLKCNSAVLIGNNPEAIKYLLTEIENYNII